jgi:hypothetical protein
MHRYRYLTFGLFVCAVMSAQTARPDDSADPLNALMMGGTDTPTPSIDWQDRIVAAYSRPGHGWQLHSRAGANARIGGVPYDQVVTELNNSFDPILGLFGPVGAPFTS